MLGACSSCKKTHDVDVAFNDYTNSAVECEYTRALVTPFRHAESAGFPYWKRPAMNCR